MDAKCRVALAMSEVSSLRCLYVGRARLEAVVLPQAVPRIEPLSRRYLKNRRAQVPYAI